jgi:beta-glucanase (GH16 family)
MPNRVALAAGVAAGFAAAAAASPTPPSFCAPSTAWVPVWADEFDGPGLDPSSWSTVNGNDVGSCREAWCDPSAVAVANGTLVLTSTPTPAHGFSFTTGAVNSKGKRFWAPTPTYRLCVSAILPGGTGGPGTAAGVWPAHCHTQLHVRRAGLAATHRHAVLPDPEHRRWWPVAGPAQRDHVVAVGPHD